VISGSDHISFAQIADLVEGRLSGMAQAQAQAHAASCPRCAAEIAWLTRVVELMRADTGDDAPQQVIDRAVGVFRARRAPAPAVHQRLSAVLIFDSLRPTQPLGLRGGAPTEQQLLFNAEAFDIDIRITGSGELWAIAGQVLGPEQTGVVALHGAHGMLESALTELSEFKLAPLAPGTYTMIVQLLSVEIEISGLKVGV
jgi:anti-sigma factor RsiW